MQRFCSQMKFFSLSYFLLFFPLSPPPFVQRAKKVFYYLDNFCLPICMWPQFCLFYTFIPPPKKTPIRLPSPAPAQKLCTLLVNYLYSRGCLRACPTAPVEGSAGFLVSSSKIPLSLSCNEVTTQYSNNHCMPSHYALHYFKQKRNLRKKSPKKLQNIKTHKTCDKISY